MKDTSADELTNALAEKKLAANPADPIATMASESRRSRGCPFFSAMQIKKPGTVIKSDTRDDVPLKSVSSIPHARVPGTRDSQNHGGILARYQGAPSRK